MWVVGCQSNPYVQAQVIHEGSLRFHCHPQTGPLQIPPHRTPPSDSVSAPPATKAAYFLHVARADCKSLR